jgi:peptidoglycan-N-acetylglucosamine deacetylase
MKIAHPVRRALAARAHAEGHWIGNHTMEHAIPLGLLDDPAAARDEIVKTQALIGSLANPDRLFRPFGRGGALGPHLLSPSAVEVLREQGMTCVLWNAVPRDWDDPHGWVETALAQCRAQPWSVVVLHDLPTGAMDHLEAFIGCLRAEGARFRQDFPAELLPIRRGEPRASLAKFVG